MNKLLVTTIALAGAGCTDTHAAITGTQSLEVQLVSPTSPGTPDQPLDDTQRTVVVNVIAKDAQDNPDPSFDTDVQVYAQFLGTLTPSFGEQPLVTFHVSAGMAMGQSIQVPSAFGPTVIWIDNGSGLGPDYVHGTVTGTSPTLFYRDPFIRDLQKPRDEMALDALSSEPLEDKTVGVNQSRHGSRGRMVVTSVFSQGYTVSDVKCADDQGTPPCVIDPVAGITGYDHALVFSFSAPADSNGDPVEEGEVIGGFAGGLSEFNGLTELGFPQTFPAVDANGQTVHDVNLARLPVPTVLDPATWFKGLSDPNGEEINFERNEAAPIQVNGAKVCTLDTDYDTFKQWKLDPTGVGGDCSNNNNVISVITTGISAIDPPSLVGKTLTSVVGVLRPLNIGSFNVWIIFPRSAGDVVGI